MSGVEKIGYKSGHFFILCNEVMPYTTIIGALMPISQILFRLHSILWKDYSLCVGAPHADI